MLLVAWDRLRGLPHGNLTLSPPGEARGASIADPQLGGEAGQGPDPPTSSN